MADKVVLIVLIFSILIPIAFAFNGHKKGFVKLAVTLLFMAGTVALSFFVNPYISGFIRDYTKLPNSKLVAFIVSYIVVMLILKMTVLSLEMISKIPVINGINRILGFAAGLCEGLFILWFMYLILMVVIPDIFENIMTSNLYLSYMYNYNLLFFMIQNYV